jgi:hypothetical protein
VCSKGRRGPPIEGSWGTLLRRRSNQAHVSIDMASRGGTFVSPECTPFEARSLRSTSIDRPYNVYEVVKPVIVQGGTVAPAFGYGGGGIQYEFEGPIQDLIDQGILKRVGP